MTQKTNKSVLFITYDLSGYYDCIKDELNNYFSHVEYQNTAYLKYKYKNVVEKIYAFFYKLVTGLKLKNYYKLQTIIEATNNKTYDLIIMVRPDIFFDSQLLNLKGRTKNFVAYYHDSINNIPRKKKVFHFFDKVYSYEKMDVKKYNLHFLTNFIYLKATDMFANNTELDAFTIMSKDFRLKTIENLAIFMKSKDLKFQFLIQSDKKTQSDLLQFISKRLNNQQVLEFLKKTKIIVDIHKYGIQDGLTFRIFESLFFNKKIITTNTDIKNYDFYNPNNIYVIENSDAIDIPENFFKTPYQPIPDSIYQKYNYTNWVQTIIS
ncbi:MAG: hypothetical protein ABIO60_12420 [Aquaticitalea sp.]